jgi:hypothetical protein
MLWIWGLIALVLLWRSGSRDAWKVAGAAALWMVITLGPYTFLSYMNRVPSRHTYLASAGLAMFIAAAGKLIAAERNKSFIFVLLCALVPVHNIGYLWVKKVSQYERRAMPTTRFLDFARANEGPIVIRCAPYSVYVMRAAAGIVLGRPASSVVDPRQNPPPAGAVDYCDPEHP